MNLDSNAPGAPVPSPCVGICCIDSDGLCFGCYRTRAELSAWPRASDSEKREILERCRSRQGRVSP
ncbi:MAG: DUF1289 domain-containing protein [Gammaproteobacteria bacterium]